MNDSARLAGSQGKKQVDNSQFSAAIQAIGDSGQHKKHFFEDARLRLKKGFTSSLPGKVYQYAQIVISVLSCLEFIMQTYIERMNPNELHYAQSIEIAFAIVFIADWCLNFILADHAVNFFFSFFSVVDVMTVVSVLSTLGRTQPTSSEVVDGRSCVLYVLFGMKTVRILRAIRFGGMLNGIKDAVERHIAEVSLDISIMILFFTALMQYLERTSQPYEYHTWIYYIWVTIATVGYGDITPQTTVGRFAAMGMIAFALISIPRMTNELIEKMKLQSVYARASYQTRNKNAKHVVICGDLSSISLQEFFDELFHEDHDSSDLNAVMLLPTPPTVDIILLMRQPKYTLPLCYLQGSALVESDLMRAKAESARAIFIMSDKFSSNPDEEDAKSILLNLSIKRYLSYHMRQDMLYCTQLIRPENRRHLSKNDANELDENDLVVCLNEIKMGAMAKAVMYPGANTLIMNLISSSSDDDSTAEDDDSWLQEYQRGVGWEIYTTQLSEVFVNARFCDLSYALYDKIGVVLFALQITDFNNGGATKLFLNPADYIIPDQGQYGIEAFVIAKNKASSDLSFSANKISRMESVASHSTRMSIAKLVKSSIVDHSIRPLSPGLDRGTIRGHHDARKSHWDHLKRQATSGSRRDSSSYQEILYHLEDDHFRRNFYTRPIPAELAEVTIETNVLEEVPHIDQHIIIIGKGLKNLFDIIRPLRARFLPMRHIVLVYPQQIPHDVWQRIAIFDGVVVVRGSSLEEGNLKRAGIFRAGQVVVLADGSTGAGGSSAGMEALVDSDAIFSYQLVKRMNPGAQVLVEIVSESNIRYLGEDPDNVDGSKVEEYRFSTQFASGTLFTTSLLDSIVSQTYYNPHIIKVVNKLLSGVDNVERSDMVVEALAQMTEKHAQYADTDSDDDLLDEEGSRSASPAQTPAPSKPKEKSARKPELRKVKSKLHNVVGSCLYQMAVPENLDQKSYGHLYQMLSSKGIIPIGILRGTFSHLNIGGKSNKVPYVFTNPDKGVELFSCDRIFVLSTSPIQISKKANFADWMLDIERQHKARTGSIAEVTRSISEVDMTNKHISDRIMRINRDVGKKLNEISHLLEEVLEKRTIMRVQSEDVGEDDGKDELLFSDTPSSKGGMAGLMSLLSLQQVVPPPQSSPEADSSSPIRKRSSPAIGSARKSISFSDNPVSGSPIPIAAPVSRRRPSMEPSLATVYAHHEEDIIDIDISARSVEGAASVISPQTLEQPAQPPIEVPATASGHETATTFASIPTAVMGSVAPPVAVTPESSAPAFAFVADAIPSQLIARSPQTVSPQVSENSGDGLSLLIEPASIKSAAQKVASFSSRTKDPMDAVVSPSVKQKPTYGLSPVASSAPTAAFSLSGKRVAPLVVAINGPSISSIQPGSSFRDRTLQRSLTPVSAQRPERPRSPSKPTSPQKSYNTPFSFKQAKEEVQKNLGGPRIDSVRSYRKPS